MEYIRELIKPHYIAEIFLSVVYFITKFSPPFCTYFYSSTTSIKNNYYACELDWREKEILMFLGICIIVKLRKETNFFSAFKLCARFAKLGSLILFLKSGPSAIPLAIIYIVMLIVEFLYLPQPLTTKAVKNKADGIIYNYDMNQIQQLKDALLDIDPNTDMHIWLVCFATNSSPICKRFAPIFTRLAQNYATTFFKTSKATTAASINFATVTISDPSTLLNSSAQQPNLKILHEFFHIPQIGSTVSGHDGCILPILILYVNGIEKIRRPQFEAGITPNQQSSTCDLAFDYESLVETFKLKKMSEDLNKHMPARNASVPFTLHTSKGTRDAKKHQ